MKLRRVNYLEINKDLESLPDGVFGYLYAHNFEDFPFDPLKLKFNKSKLREFNPNFLFRVEKISDKEIRLFGYVNDESQLIINDGKNKSEKESIIFPISYKEFKNLVYISLIQNNLIINPREIETSSGESIHILEIKKTFKKIEEDPRTQLDNIENENREKIFKLFPEFYGIGINIEAVWQKIKDFIPRKNRKPPTKTGY
jgi:hypothetical protein